VVKRIPENSPRRARRNTKVKKGEKLFLSCFRPLRALPVLRGEKNSVTTRCLALKSRPRVFYGLTPSGLQFPVSTDTTKTEEQMAIVAAQPLQASDMKTQMRPFSCSSNSLN
jgi:hypothetical protein